MNGRRHASGLQAKNRNSPHPSSHIVRVERCPQLPCRPARCRSRGSSIPAFPPRTGACSPHQLRSAGLPSQAKQHPRGNSGCPAAAAATAQGPGKAPLGHHSGGSGGPSSPPSLPCTVSVRLTSAFMSSSTCTRAIHTNAHTCHAHLRVRNTLSGRVALRVGLARPRRSKTHRDGCSSARHPTGLPVAPAALPPNTTRAPAQAHRTPNTRPSTVRLAFCSLRLFSS
jgi:hypothetical protein